MENKSHILILFDGQQLAFSPTIAQLYDELSKDHTVTILAEISSNFSKEKLTGRNVIYYEVIKKKPAFIYSLYFFFQASFNTEKNILKKRKIKFREYYYRYRLTKKLIQSGEYDRVIAVDVKNLFYCTLFNQRADLLSLELGVGEKLIPFINTRLINCIITQSKERLEYLFPHQSFKTFYIQNSPVYKEIEIPQKKKGLLYGGTAWDPFGFYHCLRYLRSYKEETLTVQGAVPKGDREKIKNKFNDLISEKRLIINEYYIENDKVVDYFSQFEIGFCFYNFNYTWINNFNYKSAPSGKMFKYLAAGVPVVAVDIIGFTFVKEFKCGVLIENLSEEKIREAILQIRNDYSTFSANALTAAKHFSFDKMVKPYLDFVKENKIID